MAHGSRHGVRERPSHEVPEIPRDAHPAQATTPVLQRVRTLRLGLVDVGLGLNERKRRRQLSARPNRNFGHWADTSCTLVSLTNRDTCQHIFKFEGVVMWVKQSGTFPSRVQMLTQQA